MSARKSLVGQRFGKVVVVADWSPKPLMKRAAVYLCHCDCGEERIVRHGNLTSGATTNCGCNPENSRRERKLRHGHTTKLFRSRTYRSWASLIQRNVDAVGFRLSMADVVCS
jgi:hypothetical protein